MGGAGGFFFPAASGGMFFVRVGDKEVAALREIRDVFHYIFLLSVVVKANFKLIGVNVRKQAHLRVRQQLHPSQRKQVRNAKL